MRSKMIKILDENLKYAHSITINLPSVCPKCGKGMFPDIVGQSNITQKDSSKIFTVIFLCPICGGHFVETYQHIMYEGLPLGYTSKNIFDAEVPEKIRILFPKFYDIYSQSLTAESYGLTELIGIGFRKSIEFLIKDFLIKIKNFPIEEISGVSLQNAINKIDDTRIKTLATKIYWLGNDETHYIRKHEDRDYKDIKDFIKALYSYINYELIYLDADSIPKK